MITFHEIERDFRTQAEKVLGWRVEYDAIIPCIRPKYDDIVVFRAKDIGGFLDATYASFEVVGEKVWVHGGIEVAKTASAGRIMCKTCILTDHFLKREQRP